MKRLLIAGALLIGGVALAFPTLKEEALKRAYIKYNEFDLRTAGTLRVGDVAPNPSVHGLDGEARPLLGDKGRPRVLVFGSYT